MTGKLIRLKHTSRNKDNESKQIKLSSPEKMDEQTLRKCECKRNYFEAKL